MPDVRADRPPLLVFADDWGRHPSSCQHLVKRLRDDFPILWANTIGTRRVRANSFTVRRGIEKIKNWRKGIVRISDQMWTIDLPMLPMMGTGWVRAINRQLVSRRLTAALEELGLERPIVMTTLPFVSWMIRDVSRRGLVYYCTDDYSHWPEADRAALQASEQELIRDADFSLGVSQALFDRLSGSGPCRFFPHGVDLEHFASVQQVSSPTELSAFPGPRIGFFGLIYEKLSFELLAAVARQYSHGTLVMIGPLAHCPDSFQAIPNVKFVGPKPYSDLPGWIAGLDVLLLPYVDDDMIRQSGPLKLRECLATGKPTVSVDVPEVRRYQPHVRVAGTQAAFLHEIAAALAEGDDPTAAQRRRLAVAHDSWDRRASELKGWLDAMTPQARAVPAMT